MRAHDFSATEVHEMGRAAHYVCQNPDCRRFTGFVTTEGRPRRVADAAHILPSGAKGPRAGEISNFNELKISSSENGIWLCKICHGLVDADEKKYPAQLLIDWKVRHREFFDRVVGKDVEAVLLGVWREKRYHQEVRGILSYFDSRRVLYQDLNEELPSLALESLGLIRERLLQVRAVINSDTELYNAIGAIQLVIDRFLSVTCKGIDLRKLRCNGGDERWRTFSKGLRKLRKDIEEAVQDLAKRSDYEFSRIGK